MNLPASSRDKVKPQSNQTVKLELHFTNEQYEKLKQIKSIYSHKFPEQKISDIIEFLCDQVLAKGEKRKVKTEKIEKAATKSRAPRNASQNNIVVSPECPALSVPELAPLPALALAPAVAMAPVLATAPLKSIKQSCAGKTRHVPNEIRRFVLRRAGNKCEFTSKNGLRCNSEYQLEIEHRVPFSQGGSHSVENIAIFCSHHNAHSASQLSIGFENFI